MNGEFFFFLGKYKRVACQSEVFRVAVQSILRYNIYGRASFDSEKRVDLNKLLQSQENASRVAIKKRII